MADSSFDLNALECALPELRNAIGSAYVILDRVELRAAETATFQTQQIILAILRPDSTSEVQACVRIANQYRLKLYPISGGKNWGLGSRVPPTDRSVLLDLGRMNRILEVNEKMAYATVEPGVTFQQLFDFIQGRKLHLTIDGTGSSPHSSVIGNTAERGHGLGPYGERFDHVCNLEVVLPTGDRIQTGHGRFANAATANVHRWGVGPFLDGMFTQSNLGIITRMTMFLLVPAPYFQSYFFDVTNIQRLAQLIDVLQRLRQTGLHTTFRIFNDYRLVSFLAQYPWSETNGATPLPESSLRRLRRMWVGFGAWNVHGALYSPSRSIGIAERKLLQSALRGKVDRLVFLNETKARLLRWIGPTVRKLTGVDWVRFADWGYFKSILRGNLNNASIKMCYWRKQTPAPAEMDPDRDRCGILWVCPCLPFDGNHVSIALRQVYQICKKNRFEPNVGLLCMTERTIELTIAIAYDRDAEGEDEKAMSCHNELVSCLMAAGYYPYRLGIQQMHLLQSEILGFDQCVASIKQALDPNGVLAPGRYEFMTRTAPQQSLAVSQEFGAPKLDFGHFGSGVDPERRLGGDVIQGVIERHGRRAEGA